MPGGDPPRRLLLRAVRILLECILVYYIFSCLPPRALLLTASRCVGVGYSVVFLTRDDDVGALNGFNGFVNLRAAGVAGG